MHDIRLAVELVKKKLISADQCIEAVDLVLSNRDPIGKIALLSGMLTVAEVGRVLYQQAGSKKTFGEMARELQLLNEDDIKTLLYRQTEGELTICDSLVALQVLSQEEADRELENYRNRIVKSHEAETSTWVSD